MKSNRLKKETVLTIPNMMSLFRIFLIPVIVWLYCGRKQYTATIVVIAISGLSDVLDGKIARKFNMVSDVGKVLDPIADKLTQASLVICLISRYKWMWALLALFAVKEGLMAFWGYQTLKVTDTINSAKWYGKVSTVVLYSVMLLLIFFANMPAALANGLMLLCAGVMLMSLVLYGRFYHSILKDKMPKHSYQNLVSKVVKILAVIVWAAVILVCFLHRDDLTVEELLRYTPQNLWAAAAVMLGLFALKSLTVVLYSGILYIIDGILFPLPAAILLNFFGTVVMLSLPFLIGRKTGATTVEYVRSKYPKAESIHQLRTKNDLVFAFAARIIRLPSDIVSLYMGAISVDYKKYLLGSLLGMLPHMITYPIMGMSITDIHSPQFLISLCVEVAYILITSAVYLLYRRGKKENPGQA